ncbi:DNA damage-inducible protein I [Klebsiella michiganensis]|nr:DNA damage-inducible protein I [Klebsiella michiganensis]
MRIEVSIAKSTALPNGALDALNNELSRRIEQQFPSTSSQVTVRYAANNNLSVIGGLSPNRHLRVPELFSGLYNSRLLFTLLTKQ